MYAFLALALVSVSGQQSAASAPEAEDPIICQSPKEHTVGTRIKKSRVCKAKSEWAAEERATQRQLQKFKDSRTDPGPASGR